MGELLLFSDLTLAVLAIAAALIAGTRTGARLRRRLVVLAVVVGARLVVACLLLVTGGLLLADSRLLVQVPLAVVPTAVAVVRPGRSTALVAAAGTLLSVWWLLAPFGPQDAAYVLGLSLGTLGLIGVLSVLAGRRHKAGSWLIVTFVLAPAVALVVAGQANASAEEHRHGGAMSVEQLTGPRAGTPDVELTLTAARGPIRLASGRTVDGLTFNGQSPGPQIRARTGRSGTTPTATDCTPSNMDSLVR